MKKILLSTALLFACGLSAQTTHMINWFMGVSSDDTTMTIENGDTVTWTWTDNAPHTITSDDGGAETFDSGTLTGSGETFSHTFTVDGTTGYHCNVHASMVGEITVTTTAGTADNSFTGFRAYPNPVTDILYISAQNNIDRVEVYDVSGRAVTKAKATTPNVNIYMKAYPAGNYIIKAWSGSSVQNITVIKN